MKEPSDIIGVNVFLILSGTFSIIGTSCIILTFICIDKSVRKSHWVLFWLSVSDFFASVSSIFAGFLGLTGTISKPSEWLCYFQACLIHGSNLASFLWTACIVVKMLLQYHGLDRLQHENIIFHSICWGIPLIQIIWLSSIKEWGDNGTDWCWINGDRNPYRLTFYGPLVIIIIFCAISVITVFVRLPKPHSKEERKTRRIILNMAMYPLVLVLCWTGALTNRLQNAIDPGHPIELLYIFHYAFLSLQGFFNAIIFALVIRSQRKIQQKINSLPQFAEYRHLIDDDR